jgi:hypothetical protein
MKKILMCLLVCLACTDERASRDALQSAGFKEIHLTGYDFFRCAEGDTFATGFIAKNTNGQLVKGTVCCGWMKGCTIRF